MRKIIISLLFLMPLFSFIEKNETSLVLSILTENPRQIYWQFGESVSGWVDIQRAGSEGGKFNTQFSLNMVNQDWGNIGVDKKGYYRVVFKGPFPFTSPFIYSNVVVFN